MVTARGIHIRAFDPQATLFRLPIWLASLALVTAFKSNATARLITESVTALEEMKSSCRDVLAEARRLGIDTPRLEADEALFR